MKRECLELLINNGREIEFIYHGNRYSITYYNDDKKKNISVCKFYENPIDVSSAEEALKLRIGKYTLEEIFASLPDSSIDIY
jgi:hypothetical protein